MLANPHPIGDGGPRTIFNKLEIWGTAQDGPPGAVSSTGETI